MHASPYLISEIANDTEKHIPISQTYTHCDLLTTTPLKVVVLLCLLLNVDFFVIVVLSNLCKIHMMENI